jgi:BCD family chlorophyll transporter-like MFS transporter
MFLGGALRDLVSGLAAEGALGAALIDPATGYSFVYHVEMYLLFVTLIVIGPLVKRVALPVPTPTERTGLADLSG